MICSKGRRLMRRPFFVDRAGWARGKGVEFAEFLIDPSCAPEGGTAAKLTGCSDDQPVQTTLLSGCWRQPSSPSSACTDQEKLAAHSKPFSPGPSIPHPYTGPPFIPIVSQGVVLPPQKKTRLRKARFFRSSKKQPSGCF